MRSIQILTIRIMRVAAAAIALAALSPARAEAASDPAPSASAAPAASARASASASASAADPLAERFVSQCSGCHTIGGGKLKGPDLDKALGWSESSLSLAIGKMQKNVGPLAEADVKGYAALLRSPDVRARVARERARVAAELAAKLAPPDAGIGRALFFGKTAFANGGLACAACHRVAGDGGSLGPELTRLATKLDAVGMTSALEQTNFAVMRDAYREHPVTQQEAVHLAAFFQTVTGSTGTFAHTADVVLTTSATAVPAVTMLALLALHRHRKTSVRARLVRDAMRR